MDRENVGCSRRAVLSTALVIGLMVVVLGGLGLTIDRICVANLTLRLPQYPGATVVWERHNLLTPFGMGETVMMLTTPDSPETVREWYARHTGEVLRANVKNPFFQWGRGEWIVDPAQDGPGSQIILHGLCMQ